jgi:hypothetical protein
MASPTEGELVPTVSDPTDPDYRFWRDPNYYVRDASGRTVGINWDWLRQDYMKRCSPDELTSMIRKMRPVTPQAARPQPNAVPASRVDLLCNYYLANNKIPWIAKEMKMAEATVRKYLVERGIYDKNRDRSRGR